MELRSCSALAVAVFSCCGAHRGACRCAAPCCSLLLTALPTPSRLALSHARMRTQQPHCARSGSDAGRTACLSSNSGRRRHWPRTPQPSTLSTQRPRRTSMVKAALSDNDRAAIACRRHSTAGRTDSAARIQFAVSAPTPSVCSLLRRIVPLRGHATSRRITACVAVVLRAAVAPHSFCSQRASNVPSEGAPPCSPCWCQQQRTRVDRPRRQRHSRCPRCRIAAFVCVRRALAAAVGLRCANGGVAESPAQTTRDCAQSWPALGARLAHCT